MTTVYSTGQVKLIYYQTKQTSATGAVAFNKYTISLRSACLYKTDAYNETLLIKNYNTFTNCRLNADNCSYKSHPFRVQYVTHR